MKQTTVKRLYAVSGNRCAFPRCRQALVQKGVVVGEMCHIKGKKGGPRYDKTQSKDEREAYENFILMCSIHHKIIDTDVGAYPEEKLYNMKQRHERRQEQLSRTLAGGRRWRLTDNQAAQFTKTLNITYTAEVMSFNQSGGQTALTINNIHYAPAPADTFAPALSPVVDSPMNSPVHPAIDIYDFRVRIRNDGKKAVRNFSLEIEVPNAYAPSNVSSSIAYVPNHERPGVTLYRRSSEEPNVPVTILRALQTSDSILSIDYQIRRDQYAGITESIAVLLYADDEYLSRTEFPIADFRNKDRMKQLGLT